MGHEAPRAMRVPTKKVWCVGVAATGVESDSGQGAAPPPALAPPLDWDGSDWDSSDESDSDGSDWDSSDESDSSSDMGTGNFTHKTCLSHPDAFLIRSHNALQLSHVW